MQHRDSATANRCVSQDRSPDFRSLERTRFGVKYNFPSDRFNSHTSAASDIQSRADIQLTCDLTDLAPPKVNTRPERVSRVTCSRPQETDCSRSPAGVGTPSSVSSEPAEGREREGHR